ncbi:MAG: molybdopterin-guanine dinucleotide biosynthesis protein B [Litorivicinaceae bacterium]|jgi:molybdopterin-guanine dinucleotide biosynthesis adapter protein|nr:molybdopterin-guanine dinucleotide biosynthesis protein B [Litorivicinaceae bacterium]MDP5328750.1 molybdopterin-guanine dinucleotide biosynthesis protein B [Litorivicinaceae bacterium]MDP5330364.1 molybdopterin-guanine dinucleotide biosynthesis protein B [Litorivicinaceae bacterium]MDP5340177.1 molybdopterin-guanine dinucleotide biosynthesis protein B [Litorivicinaceae bacterium]MDP5342832.1 molybdopterin-guanine dinucleotide biosynthesis protein B [Litorivicinaceae bacterium]
MIIFGIVGWKNTGKTTLTERLVTTFTQRGLVVSTIKHTHHDVDIDVPGTDSYRHRAAGAHEVLLASGPRWALMHESSADAEPSLEALLDRLAPVDLVLVEGYKYGRHPRLEVYRAGTIQPPIGREDRSVLALVTDAVVDDWDRPRFDLDAIDTIADFIHHTVRLP